MAKYGKAAGKSVESAMHREKKGTLKSVSYTHLRRVERSQLAKRRDTGATKRQQL